MNTSNHRDQGGASQAGRKRTRRGKTARIGDDIPGAFKTISDKAGAGPARTGKGKSGCGLHGRLLPAVLCHPRLGWRDWIALAVIYALPASGPNAGLRGGVMRLQELFGGCLKAWRKHVKQWERMKLVRLKRVRGEKGPRIVRAKHMPRTFWRQVRAEYNRRELVPYKPKGNPSAGGVARLGYFNTPPGLLTDPRLSLPAQAIRALLLWMQSWGSTGLAYPETRTIARWLKMSLQVIGPSLKELQAKRDIVETGKTTSGVRLWKVNKAIRQVGHLESPGRAFGIARSGKGNRITSYSDNGFLDGQQQEGRLRRPVQSSQAAAEKRQDQATRKKSCPSKAVARKRLANAPDMQAVEDLLVDAKISREVAREILQGYTVEQCRAKAVTIADADPKNGKASSVAGLLRTMFERDFQPGGRAGRKAALRDQQTTTGGHDQSSQRLLARSDWARKVQQATERAEGAEDMEKILVKLQCNAEDAGKMVTAYGVPMVRDVVLALTRAARHGHVPSNIPDWIKGKLRSRWAEQERAAEVGKAGRADAVNAPAEIEIEWTPEARAALESGRLPECTEQDAVRLGIACWWPHLVRSVWENVIRVSDPTTAAALRSYLAEMDQGTRPAVET